jgi:hypothetical protein
LFDISFQDYRTGNLRTINLFDPYNCRSILTLIGPRLDYIRLAVYWSVAVWAVVPCALCRIEGCHRFGGICYFNLTLVCATFVFRERDRGSSSV